MFHKYFIVWPLLHMIIISSIEKQRTLNLNGVGYGIVHVCLHNEVLGVIFLNRPQTSKPGLEMQRFLNVDVFGQFPNITFSFRKHDELIELIKGLLQSKLNLGQIFTLVNVCLLLSLHCT